MKILSAEQIRACDAYTIEHEPISSVDLMERAANALLKWMLCHYKPTTNIVLIAGKGNNGGDVLALARLLNDQGFSALRVIIYDHHQSPTFDFSHNLELLLRLNQIEIEKWTLELPLPQIEADVIIDGLFGSGLNRPIEGELASFIEHLNQNPADIISIDMPSGLFCEDNLANYGAIIKATHTLSFEVPKLAFFFAENYQFVGRWHVLPIGLHPHALKNTDTSYETIEHTLVESFFAPRLPHSYKGTFGHAFLVAGSYQMTGAAILSARAALRSGVGLLTVHIPQTAYQIMQTAVPEAMVCIDESEFTFCQPDRLEPYSAVGIGPGIGQKPSMVNAMLQILKNQNHPMVLDADALNILAQHPDFWQFIPPNTILTPHPGEFDRLTQKYHTTFERFKSQQALSKKHRIIIVLKGRYTAVSLPDGRVFFNTTGNPGMATGGSGDVLTGIILSLLAQQMKPANAAIAGVYLHGLAGDFAAANVGEISLIASDIINHLPKAFNTIKTLIR